jgi:large subunit ribosomal protein L25
MLVATPKKLAAGRKRRYHNFSNKANSGSIGFYQGAVSMSVENIVIPAQMRALSTKGSTRKLRLEGNVPAVVYGSGKTHNISVAVKALPKGHTRSNLIKLDVEGKTLSVLMREVQVNPLTDAPTHIDFQEVKADQVVTVRVPLEFVGLTREQEKEGSFKTLIRSLEVQAPAAKLPSTLKVKVGQLAVDQTAHISDVELPEGIKLRSRKNLALASLVRM